MIYNRANIGHVNYALTAFAIILVLSILFSGDPIVSAQGPRQVELNHPTGYSFCSRTKTGRAQSSYSFCSRTKTGRAQSSYSFSQEPRQVELDHPIHFCSRTNREFWTLPLYRWFSSRPRL